MKTLRCVVLLLAALLLLPAAVSAAAAAMAQATPTSPWQPTSAPEMEALALAILPNRLAVARARRMVLSSNSQISCTSRHTAGSTPQEPQVGAVTTTPPAAFSSAQASAYENKLFMRRRYWGEFSAL